nr:putative F-box/LRR-repeat protein 23 [Aegilops tauschii subsp. strangulata]
MDHAAPRARDWSLLPLDVLSSIFIRIGAVDVLMGAGLVCRSWLEAAKLPEVWRAVDMDKHEVVFTKCNVVLRAMAKAAVDRADGQLRSFAGKLFVTNELIKYIVERCFFLPYLAFCSKFCYLLLSITALPQSKTPYYSVLYCIPLKNIVFIFTPFKTLHYCLQITLAD